MSGHPEGTEDVRVEAVPQSLESRGGRSETRATFDAMEDSDDDHSLVEGRRKEIGSGTTERPHWNGGVTLTEDVVVWCLPDLGTLWAVPGVDSSRIDIEVEGRLTLTEDGTKSSQ